MSNKSIKFLKPKLKKRNSSAKTFESTATGSLYSGIPSAEYAIKNLELPYSIPSNQSKHSSEIVVVVPLKEETPIPRYHLWEPKYKKVFVREKIKKSMTKDLYTPILSLIAHANENIVTEEECSPALIAADAIVCIEKPVVLLEEAKIALPNIVRYGRGNEVKTSARFAPQFSTKKSLISQLQIETNTPIPMIGINKHNGVVPNLVSTDRLLNRAKMRNDTSIVRRVPRIPVMDTIHETIAPLSIYC